MKYLLSFLFITFFSLSLLAQKKSFTLDDVVNGGTNYRSFYPETLASLQWINDDTFSYLQDDTTLVCQSITGSKKKVLTLGELKELTSNYKGQKIPSHQWHNGDVLEFRLPQERLFYKVKDKTSWRITYPEGAANTDLNYAAGRLAYTMDNNLYYATSQEEKIAVSENENPHIINGQTVHRNEFGIHKGTFWSPNGDFLAFYSKDETMVEDYPLVDILARQAKVRMIKYPMAGMSSEEVKVGIYNVANGNTTYLDTGEPKDRYFTNIAWSPDNRFLYIAELNRGQDTMMFNCYNANSGQRIKTLFTETDEEYVEPQNPMVFLPSDPEKFIWQSRRSGYNHLYLYNTNGELIRQLSKGKWEVTSILGFDKADNRGSGKTKLKGLKEKHIYISATKKSHLERHAYAVSIDKEEMRCMTDNEGVHRPQLSPNGHYMLDTWSNTETPLKIDLIKTKEAMTQNLFTAGNPYDGYELGEMKLLEIPSADTSLLLTARMILPPDFDRKKKYPAIIYVYGGPHSQMINQGWLGGVRMWQHYMAQKGFVMFTLDNRGTSYRGADFEQVIHRELGKHEMEDQMKGYEYLTAHAFIDSTRIGVFGWSFGGFMTTSLMTHYPEAFKVGVAGGPVIDWSNYEVMYGERYMDSPADNPKGYSNTTVSHYAKDLKGRLLMIHGAQDPVVVWQHSQKFVRQCVKDGVPLDYFVYPTHEHNVRGQDRVHLMRKITQYFEDFL